MIRNSPNNPAPCVANVHLLSAYVADLELEVDCPRKQSQFIHHEGRETLKRVHLLYRHAAGGGGASDRLAAAGQAATHLAAVVRDLQEPPGCHPARAAGLGVGLAIVKLLMDQSGGTLAVDSGEGQGTTSVVVLPRDDVEDYLV